MPSIRPSMTAEQIAAMREYGRRYRLANKEKIAAAGKVWAQANRAKRVATAIAWQKRNPEKLKAIARRYSQNHREKIRAYQRINKPLWRAARRQKRLEKEREVVAARVKALGNKPLSSIEQLSLYRLIEAILPRSIPFDARTEIANMAFIAVYEGRLPINPQFTDLVPIIAAQRREYFGKWDLSLDAVGQNGRTLGQRLGVY